MGRNLLSRYLARLSCPLGRQHTVCHESGSKSEICKACASRTVRGFSLHEVTLSTGERYQVAAASPAHAHRIALHGVNNTQLAARQFNSEHITSIKPLSSE